jgi:hypothetical protein
LKEAGRFFRGSELPRFVILLAIVAAGWGYVFWSMMTPAKPAGPQRPDLASMPPLPPADDSIEFHGVQDKDRLRPAENPAYVKLLTRVRSTPPAQLANESRHDVVFSQLVERPERYRGIPIHLQGTARRILHQDVAGSKIFAKGRYYEAYVFTADSQRNPYIAVFEDAPPGLSGGDNIWERVSFDGYFFKLMGYIAGDQPRFAPLLIGRIAPLAAPSPKPWKLDPTVLVLLGVTLYLLVRFVFQLHRSQEPRRNLASLARPTDEIDSAELSEWLGEQSTAKPAVHHDELE